MVGVVLTVPGVHRVRPLQVCLGVHVAPHVSERTSPLDEIGPPSLASCSQIVLTNLGLPSY